ncbi:YheT family hydrolase [Algiphilus aromaticivorans]|uniref:YheT family hydrolase n=1 Tax=Algiphilus aromaticivorans TaxID=382454 RepID=UPI000693CD82|nr:alpha/beta fold hydrolase [Algiphilus aromaticivorans]
MIPDFRPAPWLRAPLLQTALASFRLRRRRIRRHPVVTSAERQVLDCGDGVRLVAWISAPPSDCRGRVVLLHGWEGCHDSVYLMSAARALFDAGWQVTRLNLRDHGYTHDLNPEMFHSGRLDEVCGALKAIAAMVGGDLRVVGFSLGGNFALRLGEARTEKDLPVSQCIAVCPAIAPRATLEALDHCPKPIRRYFERKWRRSLHAKQAAWPDHYDFSELRQLSGFVTITERFSHEHTPYPGLDDYLASHDISRNADLGTVTPTTVITAKDDPVVPWSAFEHIRRSPSIRLIATEHGGHCGFIENLRMDSWIDHCLTVCLADEGIQPSN